MNKKMTAVAMVAAFAAMAASAEIVVQYDAGVTAANGEAGAADPTTQGWTLNGGGNPWADGYDSGNGGWTVVDGTSGAAAFYSQNLDAADTALMANGWTATFKVAVNADAINAGGGSVDNYYMAPNNGRQNNNALWLENNTGGYSYILTYNVNASDEVVINDGTTSWTIAGSALSQQTGAGSPDMNYLDFSLVYDAGTGDATLFEGATTIGVMNTHTINGTDRVIFGAYSGAGQGSTTWNEVTIDAIPEPATLGMVAAFGGAILFIRRKLMM